MNTVASTKVSNNFFDEAMELSESEEDMEIFGTQSNLNRGDSPPSAQLSASEDGYEEVPIRVFFVNEPKSMRGQKPRNAMSLANAGSAATIVDRSKQNEMTESFIDDEESDAQYFDPTSLGNESKTLEEGINRIMEFISRYSPQEQDLHPELKPFIPELIPCIGDIDAFIKIPRPDHRADLVGLASVDEPSAIQSDPSGIKS